MAMRGDWRGDKTLITVQLSGGLGNQLFQYAAGLALATRRATDLRLDLRKFRKSDATTEDPAARPVRIMDFALPQRESCTRAQEDGWRNRWNLAKNLHLPPRWFNIHDDRTLRFQPRFHDLPDGTCLRGYFQSELYFAPCADLVRQAFAPADPQLAARIEAQLNALRRPGRAQVALHIRRGDFLTVENRDCLTGDDFLEAAMARFAGADFLVFSDDADWCRARFAGRSDVTISPFTRVIEDFIAMSLCDHNILAKSTFSWWAAWLNVRAGRQVIAPAISIQDKPSWGGGSPDYYPPDWTLI